MLDKKAIQAALQEASGGPGINDLFNNKNMFALNMTEMSLTMDSFHFGEVLKKVDDCGKFHGREDRP